MNRVPTRMDTNRQQEADWESGAPEQLDEAFGVVRRLPASAVAWWICGATPMVLAALFFSVDHWGTRRAPPAPASWAAVLAAAFVWLKVSGAFFAREVWRQRLPVGGLPVLGWGDWFRRTGALLVVSAVWLPVFLVSVPLVFPLGMVVAIGQHMTSVAYTQDLGSRPVAALMRLGVRQAFREVLGGHLVLLMMAVTAVMAWGSLFVLGLLIPFLLKLLSGVESEFTRSPLAVALSPVYLCATSAITWMLVSPYHRVVHVLSAFRALSRRTGDDLLARLQALPAILVVGCWLMAGVAAGPAAAAEPPEPPTPASSARVEPAALADAIEATLDQRDYRWWQPEDPAASEEAKSGGFLDRVKRVASSIQAAVRSIREFWGDAGRFLKRWLGGSGDEEPGVRASGGWFGEVSGRWLTVLGVVGAGAVLLGLLVRRLRRRRESPVEARPEAGPAARVDLADDATLASALPESEWLMLARREQEAGDWRLAVRAVFLAMLASLAERRLIDIGRTKSNRDYAAELRRRSAAGPDEVDVFAESVGLFERAWYGWHDAGPEWVHTLLQNHQRLRAHDRS